MLADKTKEEQEKIRRNDKELAEILNEVEEEFLFEILPKIKEEGVLKNINLISENRNKIEKKYEKAKVTSLACKEEVSSYINMINSLVTKRNLPKLYFSLYF